MVGSGSTSGNVDLDPGTKKKTGYTRIPTNQPNYKNIIFFERNHLFCLIYTNDKLKITTKSIVMSFKPYTEKVKKKKIGICSILGRIRIQNRIRIHYPGSGSASK